MKTMNRRLLARLVVLAVLLGCSSTGRTAVETFTAEAPGLYLAGVGFFAAVPSEAGANSIAVRFGDLETLDWVPGALPVVDAHVLLINSSGRRVADLGVRVSLYLGNTVLSAIAGGEDLKPGAENIQESLFFERVYRVRNVEHARVSRIAVRDIHLSEVIQEQMERQRWPAYLRVEATVVEKPEWLEAPISTTTGLLKVVPRNFAGPKEP